MWDDGRWTGDETGTMASGQTVPRPAPRRGSESCGALEEALQWAGPQERLTLLLTLQPGAQAALQHKLHGIGVSCLLSDQRAVASVHATPAQIAALRRFDEVSSLWLADELDD